MTTRQDERQREPDGQDLDNFEQIYKAHGQKIYRLCLRLTMNREEAEDLTLETLHAAYRSRGAFNGKSSVETWLYGIALNKWRTHCRRIKEQPASLEELEAVSETMRIENMAMAHAIAALPQDWREAFLLVKGEGLTYAEAALALRISTGATRFRTFSAIQRLRKALVSEPFRCETACAGRVGCKNEV